MSTPDEPAGGSGGEPAEGATGPSRVKAVVVLAVFVGLVVLVLGQVHPGGSVGGGAAAAPTTTQPPAPTTTTTTIAKGKVAVLVANGAGASGLAGTISTQLQAAGWHMLPAVNATSHVSASTVYYTAGNQPAAQAIAATLHVAPADVKALTTSVPVSSVSGAQVVVVAGPDLVPSPTSSSG